MFFVKYLITTKKKQQLLLIHSKYNNDKGPSEPVFVSNNDHAPDGYVMCNVWKNILERERREG